MDMYDVYLKRLTEIDVMITQLLHTDSSFKLNDLLTIYAIMNAYILKFNLKIEANTILDASRMDTFKMIHESTLFTSFLSMDIPLVKGVFTGGESDMEISIDEIDAIRKYPVSGDSVLDISVDPLEYYFTLLCGNIEVNLELLADVLDVLKYSNIDIDSISELLIDTNLIHKDIIAPENVDLWLSIDRTDIFYRKDTEAEMLMYLDALVDKVVIMSLIYDIEAGMLIDAIADFSSIKFLEMNFDALLSTISVDVLKKVFDIFDLNMEIFCEASAGIRRYRLLSEMDDLTLADLDNMSLRELDYVIIAD